MSQALIIRGLRRVVRSHPTEEHPVGAYLAKDGVQGIRGLPAGRRQALARAVAHGEHDTPVYLPSRVMTFDGHLLAWTVEQLDEFIDSITGWGGTGQRFALTLETQRERYAWARRVLAEAPSPSGRKYGGRFHARFQVQFIAADPRLYGKANDSPLGTVHRLEHDGNFPSHPIIEIPNAPATWTATASTGEVFTVTGATAGGTHRLSLIDGQVTRDGVLMRSVGRGRLWSVPEGEPLTATLSHPGRVNTPDTSI